MNSQEVTKSSGSNFASSFWFLPKEKRSALTAVYAWCRLTDDIVDNAGTPEAVEEARVSLENWRKGTVKALKETSSHPVLRELAEAAARYKIPEIYFHELIDGVAMDWDKKSYKTFDELYPYCYRVASIVGLMCIEIFGYKDPKTREYAVDLGVAFQMTNIIRDIRTDAGRGRVYLPEEDLKKFNFSRESILKLADGMPAKEEDISRFKELVDFECKRAEHFYKKAEENLPRRERSNMAAAEIMNAVYHSILLKIKQRPFSVLETKVKLSRPEAFFRVFQGWIKSKL